MKKKMHKKKTKVKKAVRKKKELKEEPQEESIEEPVVEQTVEEVIETKEEAQPQEEPTHKGALLKKVREEKGISLMTIHEATKVPLDALRAIEEGYTIRTLSDFYYRSFVKIYAQYLEVDVTAVLDDYKTEVLPKHVDDSASDFEFNLLDKIDKVLTRQRQQQIFYVLVVLVGLFFLFKVIGFLMSRQPAQPRMTQERQVEQAVKEVEKKQEAVIPTPIPPQNTSSKKHVEPQAFSSDVVLTVRAKKSSWLRVKADGNIVFQSTLNAGDVESWSANEKIEISGRNIGELEFELNGKLIGSLGRASRRAKGLVATKDGLSVTK